MFCFIQYGILHYDVDIEISEFCLKTLRSQKITNVERKYLVFIIVKVLYLTVFEKQMLIP